ncbi:MAG: tripartite tricarboxylate transporter TctB family protein [bacterium]|nr:tripartite tricarboxylate transporter TctB family protein [bacterium]MDT8367233.1 tripartite tricarboxylate transporter TctB family protein [bacterium]
MFSEGKKRRTDKLAGLILLVMTLIYAYMAFQFKIPFMSDPIGPKAFPLIIAGMTLVFSVFLIARPDEDPDWPDRKVWLRKALVLASFVIYAYALVPLGFLVSTTLEITFLAVMFDGKASKGLVAAIVTSLVLYTLFVFILSIPLPFGKIFGG